MNTYSFIAGIIALVATVGHLTIGTKSFYKPLKNANLDPKVRIIFMALFHYITAFQVLSTIVLIMIGIRGSGCSFEPLLALGFIGGNYLLWAIVQLVIVTKSPIKKAALKMFQWMFWLVISLFCFMAFKFAWDYIFNWV